MRIFYIGLAIFFVCLAFQSETAFSSDCGNVYLTDNIDYIAPNPVDPEDSETGGNDGVTSGDYGKITMPDPGKYHQNPTFSSRSSNLTDEKTKYYSDENIEVIGQVKNVGSDVPKSINEIHFKLYRFRGEKENNDTKEVGDENIKGENLESGDTKDETFKFSAPDDENVYQFYGVIDTKGAVDEANDGNNGWQYPLSYSQTA